MIIKGMGFKLIMGILTTLGIAATGVYFVSYRPAAPTDLLIQTLQDTNFPLNNCAPVVGFYDRSVNEEDFRVYRRKSGESVFTLIQILPASKPGKGKQIVTANPGPLPLGTYEFRVSAYNAYGEAFSEIKSVTVDWPDCKNVVPVNMTGFPLNPVIVSLSVVNNCYVRISYRDNSTNEQGLKIYRAKQYQNNVNFYEKETMIATLGIHNGVPGNYDDKAKLADGTYRYRMSAYNQSGESFSSFMEVKIDPICNPTMQLLPSTAAPTAMMVVTAEQTPMEACTWEAVSNVFLRKGPDVGLFDRLVDVESGKILPIVGQSEDGTFWVVQVSSGESGYITKSEKYSLTHGDCGAVPTLADPSPPEILPAPTRNPHTGSSASQCSDGVDNDGDGFVDYNTDPAAGDPGCSGPGDNSE